MDDAPWAPELSEKQLAVFNCYKRYVLCAGGRRNGKSVAVGHKVFRHLWETPGARVALIATTIKAAKESGAFSDLTEIVAPIWMNSGIVGQSGLPLEYTSKGANGLPGPRTDAATRTSSFRIRNYYGGDSELMLFSINNENEVEAITKSKRFSMVWLSEGSNFTSDQIFKNVIQILRMFHLKPEQHQLIVDTNPAEDGEDHWIYKKWFKERVQDDHPEPIIQKELALFEFQLEDNPFLSQFEIAELKASNCDNQGEYDRNVLGLWKRGHGLKGKIFADIWIPQTHVISPMIDVDEGTVDLIGGWDIGEKNHAAHIVEKRIYKGLTHYLVLEENVVIGEEKSTAMFAIEVYEKMQKIERFYQRRYNYRHWSDSSAFLFKASSETVDANIVLAATDGEVTLLAAEKPMYSVETGTKLMRRCIIENRLLVGANCPYTIEMFQELKNTDIEEDTRLKHPFDSLRYIIYMEEKEHYAEAAARGVNRESGTKLMSVR